MNKQSCASRLQAALEIRKMRQTDLCKLTGIPKSAMSQYISGAFEPKQDRVYEIAKALKVSEAWLMGYDVPMAPNSPETIKGIGKIVDGTPRMIPIFESVSAGFGTQANNCIIDYIPLMISSDAEADNTICIRVTGNSMYPKIEDGDLIQVLKQDSIDSGRVGVFLIDGNDGVVKKAIYTYGEDWLELHSFNPEYEPRRFEGPEVLRVRTLGLVKRVIKDI